METRRRKVGQNEVENVSVVTIATAMAATKYHELRLACSIQYKSLNAYLKLPSRKGEGVAIHSECVRNAFAMHSECVRNAFAMHSQCVRNALQQIVWPV